MQEANDLNQFSLELPKTHAGLAPILCDFLSEPRKGSS
jgi:hypothetical protein